MCFGKTSGSVDDNLNTLWDAIDLYYRTNKVACRYSCMKWNMFAGPKDGYPRLKGKAAEVRRIGYVLAHIWQQCMNVGDEIHVLINGGLQTSLRMEEIMDEYAHAYRFPPDIADEFMKSTITYVQIQMKLANLYGERLFLITMKHHYLIHISHRSKFINPRLGWCFMGEDFMHHLRQLALSCMIGTKRYKVSGKIAKKISIALHYQLSKED